MTAYCDKMGVSLNATRFMFDDRRLNPDQTAEQVRLLHNFQSLIFRLNLKTTISLKLFMSNRVDIDDKFFEFFL